MEFALAVAKPALILTLEEQMYASPKKMVGESTEDEKGVIDSDRNRGRARRGKLKVTKGADQDLEARTTV